ncbi:hypothetical protein TNCV_343341 [Trichonephila clavipes]|nr:hypothetical protein TNCV_343341 [Trichonephila clavipes]
MVIKGIHCTIFLRKGCIVNDIFLMDVITSRSSSTTMRRSTGAGWVYRINLSGLRNSGYDVGKSRQRSHVGRSVKRSNPDTTESPPCRRSREGAAQVSSLLIDRSSELRGSSPISLVLLCSAISPPGGATAYQHQHHSVNHQVANRVTTNYVNLALSPIFRYVSIESPL